MIRLQAELATAMELAKAVQQRELVKRDAAVQGKSMWEKRFALVDIKRKFPILGTKEDEELFQDKERVLKKIKTDVPGYVDCLLLVVHSADSPLSRLPLKLRTPRDSGEYGSPVATEPMMRPKDRLAMIQAQIDEELAKKKDHRWEDMVDVSTQSYFSLLIANFILARTPINRLPYHIPHASSSISIPRARRQSREVHPAQQEFVLAVCVSGVAEGVT